MMTKRRLMAMAVVAFVLATAGVVDGQTFRSGGSLPDINWISPPPPRADGAPDPSPLAVRAALNRAGWQRAMPLPGNEIDFIIEVAISDELGGIAGQRVIDEGVVGENELVINGGIDGPFLVAVQYEPTPAYQAIYLSGNLELDIIRADSLYRNIQPAGAAPLSDGALKVEVLRAYTAAAEAEEEINRFRDRSLESIDRPGPQGEIGQPPNTPPAPNQVCEMSVRFRLYTREPADLTVASTDVNAFTTSWNGSLDSGQTDGICSPKRVYVINFLGFISFSTQWHADYCGGAGSRSGNTYQTWALAQYHNDDFPAFSIYPGSRVYLYHEIETYSNPGGGGYRTVHSGSSYGNNGLTQTVGACFLRHLYNRSVLRACRLE